MKRARIIHLSDTHILADPNQPLFGISPDKTLGKAIRSIAKLDPAPDAVVVTGDMADTGTAAEYARFRDHVATLGVPVYWLAGNHDNSVEMLKAADRHPIAPDKSLLIGSWRLLLLNSQVPGESHGRIDRSELLFLEQELIRHPEQPTIVALHHTPCSPCVDPGCHLENHGQFLALLERHNQVSVVLAGHTHHAEKISVGHLNVFTAPSTFAQVSHPNNISQLDNDDFFASHKLLGSRAGYGVFDLSADGSYLQQWHWLNTS